MSDSNESNDDKELEEIRAKKLEQLEKEHLGNPGGNPGNPDNPGEAWPDEPLVITENNFDDIIAKYPLLVIDCWAPWCGPCRMVAPVFDELAKDYQGKIVFGRLNTDENQGIAMKHNIMSIPTFLIFKNGELIGRPVGAMPKAALEAAINEHFG